MFLKTAKVFGGLIQVFLSVCQLRDAGLSFSHLNANERASCQRAAETV